MLVFLTFVIAFVLGYFYGHNIRPNNRLREAIREVREKCMAALEEGNKGVYRTIVTDNNKSSELVVEVKELAVTQQGQVKVQLSALYSSGPPKCRQVLATARGLPFTLYTCTSRPKKSTSSEPFSGISLILQSVCFILISI